MSGFELEVEAALAIGEKHDHAAGDITEHAPSQPENIDGGIGGPYVMTILAAIGLDAGDLALLNTDVAARVRTAVDAVTGYDASAAGAFREMEERVP